MQGGRRLFERNSWDALPRASRQNGSTQPMEPDMPRTHSLTLVASLAGSLLTCVLLVGITTSLIA
jgi:hypothetical protein